MMEIMKIIIIIHVILLLMTMMLISIPVVMILMTPMILLLLIISSKMMTIWITFIVESSLLHDIYTLETNAELAKTDKYNPSDMASPVPWHARYWGNTLKTHQKAYRDYKPPDTDHKGSYQIATSDGENVVTFTNAMRASATNIFELNFKGTELFRSTYYIIHV